MSYKNTFIPKEVKDSELRELIHQLKTQFLAIEKSTVPSASTVVIRSGVGGNITVTATSDRIRTNKIKDMSVSASGTTISFLTDCFPAEAYPHNSYLITWINCYRLEGSEKVDISCDFSDFTSTTFKATPAEDGYLNFQTTLIG